jgi:anaerobic selenocysteine-containing dehydrogenase
MEPRGFVEINPLDAERLGIEEGDLVEITSRRGRLTSRARITRRSPEGVVFMSFHFSDEQVNRLTSSVLDPQAKIPELKVSAIKLQKVLGG